MSKTVIYAAQAPAPIGPYSQAIAAGNMLFLSGQIAIDQSKGTIVNASIEAETEQVMNNLKAILTAAGLTFANVVKTSIFLKSMDDFAKVNEVYEKHFADQPPARETVEVSRLPKDVRVEISCIAIR